MTDAGGGKASARVGVVVKDVAPTLAAPSGPQAVPEGANAVVNLGSIVDRGIGPWTVTVNWGDNSSSTFNPQSAGSIALAHVYAEEGTYTATETVSEGAEAPSAAVGFTVNVTDPAVVATGGYAFKAGERVAPAPQVLARFTDPGGAGGLSDYSAAIDWGDHSPVTAGSITVNAGVFSVSGTHVYAVGGSYPVAVTVGHEGAPTARAIDTATVSNIGILLLDTSGRGALTDSGSSNIVVNNGASIYIASKDPAAGLITSTGGVFAGAIDVVGGLSATGGGRFTGPVNQVPVLADPLANLPVPIADAVTKGAVNYSGSTPLTLQPGTYVGGIKLSGSGRLVLAPGLYYLKGGGLTDIGQGGITGSGVTIYNDPVSSGDAVSLKGSGSVTLSAPTSGPYAGVTIFQRRDSSVPLTVVGNGGMNITGTVYAAGAALNVTGNGVVALHGDPTNPQVVGRLIVSDLYFSSTVSLTVNGGQAMRAAGGEGHTAVSATALTPSALTVVVDEAIDLWRAAGASGQRLDALRHLRFQVTTLPAGELGQEDGGVVELSSDAAGYGWSTAPGLPGQGRMDLLTVVAHEMGHALGLGHDGGEDLMEPALGPGVRHTPAPYSYLVAVPAVTPADRHRQAAPAAAPGLPNASASRVLGRGRLVAPAGHPVRPSRGHGPYGF